ncbi:MAG: endonuclease domain-containing protein [Balneolaceae bacterium]|nr:endonuclease domain-containing protein [Balneolaceae bacterium]
MKQIPKKRKTITELAREFRKNPTESEKILWEQLRKRRLDGHRFVRQKPLIYEQNQKQRFFFIADFYCAQKKLVIEVDGPVHEYQQYYDYQRDLVLEKLGLRTLRISNRELEDMETVKRKILNLLK